MGEIISLLPMDAITLAAFGLSVALLILVIVLWRKLSKLRRLYMNMINGDSPRNMEDIIIKLQEKLQMVNEQQTKDRQALETLAGQVKRLKGNVGIFRFNAFGERGSDLSFSMAFTDEHQDGVVVTGIHNREQVYVYAKPLKQGQSQYALSPEEKEAIARSLRKE